MQQIAIFGCGYLGTHLAGACHAEGLQTLLVARDIDRLRAIAPTDAMLLAGDLDRPEPLPKQAVTAAQIVYLVPPPAAGESDPRMTRFLQSISQRPPQRVIYISTTGVYGDSGGDWIDETAPPAPQTDRGRRRLDAETQLNAHALAHGYRAITLRVAGIYGPDRLPVARLQRGEPVVAPEESGFSNRVHLDDLVATILAALQHPDPAPLYNISDGNPSSMSHYLLAVADALGMRRPPIISMAQAHRQLGSGMLSYLLESRRIDNRRMRELLPHPLRYPHIDRGIAAAIAASSTPLHQPAEG